MQIYQVSVRERFNDSGTPTRRRKSQFGAAETGGLGIARLARAARLGVVCVLFATLSASSARACEIAGDCDAFVLPTEPVFLQPTFAAWFAANANQFCDNSAFSLPFDSVDSNCSFGQSFTGCLACPAELTMRLKYAGGSNDGMALGVAPFVTSWSSGLAALELLTDPLTSLPLCTHHSGAADGAWSTNDDMTCVFNLCNLPPDADGTAAVVPSTGGLDVYVQDDTPVDCITLCNYECPCVKNADISIDLTTGVNDLTQAPIPFGMPDDTWTVTCEQVPNGSLPRPATVVDRAIIGVWADLPAPSEWISANFFGPNGDYCYQTCFCLNDGFQNPSLDFTLLADDTAEVYVHNALGVGLNLIPPPSFTSPTTYSYQGPFLPGENCIEVVVHNTGGPPTGFEMTGQFTADHAQCCPSEEIPTVSTWGLVVLALLLLTGAKVYFARREAATA